MLGWHGVLSRGQERFARKLRERLAESRSRQIIADFTIFLRNRVAALGLWVNRHRGARILRIS
jgi:hypothetical protein